MWAYSKKKVIPDLEESAMSGLTYESLFFESNIQIILSTIRTEMNSDLVGGISKNLQDTKQKLL